MLQRLQGRMQIDDDTIDRLAIGAPEWVWPYWLQRQLDVSSPAFVVGADAAMRSNVSGRNWTMVGNLGSPHRAVVDPRGLVAPWPGGWSLDWWVGAEDRWHVPARSANVRQTLIGDSPVVETRMRVPGGDMIHRTYAINATAADGGRDLVIVEIENDSAVPVAVALGVRPYDIEGLSAIERIELDGSTVTVDGRVAMLLPKAPNEVVASTLHGGDSSSAVFAGEASRSFPVDLRCDAGMAQAAFVYPLPHHATIRVAIPLDPGPTTRRGGLGRNRTDQAEAFPAAVPSADQVASGWKVQTDRGMRLVLPDERLQSAVDANRRHLLLFHDGDTVTPGPRTDQRFVFRDAAYLLAALDRFGFHREVGEVLLSYPERQENDGNLSSREGESDANGAAIWALAHHWDLTRNDELARQLAPMVAGAVEWIERKRNERRDDPALRGLLPAGESAAHLGPHDFSYWDDFWALAGLRDASRLLAAAGEDEAASRAEEFCASMTADIRASMEITAERLGTAAVPAGPRRRIDAGAVGSLAAVSPLDLLPADDKAMAATLDVVRDRFCADEAFLHDGLGTYLTMQIAFAELQTGDRHALDRLDWLLGNATPTWTWPEAIHPRVTGGCSGDGHHGWAAAEFLSFVRSMLVRETADGLALFSMIPERWYGQGVEIHDAPTRFGTVSFALRWHGARPALLWEIDRHDESVPVAITCPGIDPTWRTTEDRGEALLEAPETATVPGPEDGDSFG